MGTYEGLPFLVLEKLSLVLANELPKPSDSVSFWARRSQIKKWPLARTLRVAKELASALHYCHANSFEGCRVLHRDLKPNNIGTPPAPPRPVTARRGVCQATRATAWARATQLLMPASLSIDETRTAARLSLSIASSAPRKACEPSPPSPRTLTRCSPAALPPSPICAPLVRLVPPPGFMADGRLCLFDFGLAKMWRIADGDDGTETRPLTGNTGSLRYMAPEVALNQPYSHRAEVFAWATVVWQMLAHERPYNDCDVAAFYRRVCHRHERPKIPKDAPPQLAQLLMKCWEVDPAKRPEFEQILPIVSELYDEAIATKRV